MKLKNIAGKSIRAIHKVDHIPSIHQVTAET